MPILETFHLSKKFPGVLALDDFSFSMEKGEVRGLVGENGAGKSTLVKILSGVYRPTSGNFCVGGRVMNLRSPGDARFVGVVHQDRELVAHFNGYENLFLGVERTRGGFLEKKRMKRETAAFMEKYRMNFDLELPAERLSGGQQQMLAILKVLFRSPEIVIFDEPTAPLSVKECDILFSLIEDLREKGVAILYISHHLSEVLRLSDQVTVMRNGSKVITGRSAELDEPALIRLMLSRDVVNPHPKEAAVGDVVFKMEKYAVPALGIKPSDFYIRSGEIVGFAGLVGAGRTELAKSVFTGSRRKSGSLVLDGEAFHPCGPRESIKQGVVMIPENRRDEGLIVDMSVGENLSLPQLRDWTFLGFVDAAQVRKFAKETITRYSIRSWGLPQILKTLSGGNQQKVSIGKWNYAKARLWIFDEPTQGIDVDAKTEIYSIMGSLAERGAGVWFISSEIRELLSVADRIYVMRERKIVAEHTRPFNSEKILSNMMGD
jgi:ABC-type sugar transport system ATPase subunit